MTVTISFLIGLSVAMGLVGAWHVVLYRRLLSRLRDEHPAVWRDLGSPVMSLRITEGWRAGWATHRFPRHRAYEEIGDMELGRLATRYRIVGMCETGIFVTFLVALGFSIWTG